MIENATLGAVLLFGAFLALWIPAVHEDGLILIGVLFLGFCGVRLMR